MSIDFAAERTGFPTLRERAYFACQCYGPIRQELDADLDAYRRSLGLRNRAIYEWIELLQTMTVLTEQLLSAPASSVALMSNATAAQAAIAAGLAPRPGRARVVIAPQFDFPSSRYLWRAQAQRGFEIVEVRAERDEAPALEELLAAIDERTAVVALPWLSPRTGAKLPIEAVARHAHAVGALVVVDAYQGVGVVPLDVAELGADVVVGGHHKWLCAGCSGLAFLYVAPGVEERIAVAYPGWIGHADLTSFGGDFVPGPGASRYRQGTPPIEPLYGARAGLMWVLAVGVDAIRARSLTLTDRLIGAADALGLPLRTPREPERRGGVVCLDVAGADDLVRHLAEVGFDVDARPGAGLRIGPFVCLEEAECEHLMTMIARLRPESAR